ncbi:hypothetical protein KI387_044615, partial [Taxus chinensis]
AKIQYLGHIISGEGIIVNPSKIRAIMDWPVPTTVTEVRNFMGLVGYYKRFVQDFSRIAHPIISLQQKGKKFVWSDRCEKAFRTLKEYLTTTPILAMPDPHGEFFVCIDALLAGLGGVLMQEGKVVAFESRKLKDHELNYPTHDLELAAVVHALVRWRHFLLGRRFILRIDHLSLRHLFMQPNLNARQRHWMEFLCEYDMKIEHVKGKENVVVDTLNKQRHSSMATSVSTYLRSRILQQLPLDSFYIAARVEVESQRRLEGKFDGFSLEVDGILRHRGRIYVPRDGSLR